MMLTTFCWILRRRYCEEDNVLLASGLQFCRAKAGGWAAIRIASPLVVLPEVHRGCEVDPAAVRLLWDPEAVEHITHIDLEVRVNHDLRGDDASALEQLFRPLAPD